METIIVRENYKVGQKFNIGLCSDIHIGSKEFDEELFKEDFELFKRNDAKIFINGDLLDLILASDLRRYSPSGDKYGVTTAINEVLDESFRLLAPFVNNISGIGIGNHEKETISRHSIDTTSMIIRDLNRIRDPGLPPILHMGYSGFIRFIHFYENGTSCMSYDIFYNHGQGGNAEVTKGMIDLARYESVGADLIWLGHKHTNLSVFLSPYLHLSQKNKIVHKVKRGVITGCYQKIFKEYNIKKTGYQPDYGEERMRKLQNTKGAMLTLEHVSKSKLVSNVQN